jgi:hypothetical protein
LEERSDCKSNLEEIMMESSEKISFWKLRVETMKVKTVEQLDIVIQMINNAHLNGWISDLELQRLLSLLNKKASDVGEKRLRFSIGLHGIEISKKGKFL